MKFRLVVPLALVAAIAAGLILAPAAAQAQTTKSHRDLVSDFLQCSFCHNLHASPGGTLNTSDTFDNTCLTCHGSGGVDPNAPKPMMFHTNETCTRNCAERPFFIGCSSCHYPHGSLENRLYDKGLDHTHASPALCESSGGPVKCDGTNRKLVGTVYDGTRTAKIATPITVGSASWTGGTATINLSINNAPNPPPHTIMVGDRITVRRVWSANNPTGLFDAGFNGSFVVETVTGANTLAPVITYALATDPGSYMQNNLTRGADPETGMVQSAGWNVQPKVSGAVWTAGSPGTATLTVPLLASHSIGVGDTISVADIKSANNPGGAFGSGFNGTVTVTVVSGTELSYALATDPGAFQSGLGRIEYAGSIKTIQAASQDTGAQTLTLRITRAHAVQLNDIITAFKNDPNPATFNARDSVKRLQVTAIAPLDADRDDIVVSCLVQGQGSELCDLSVAVAVDFTGGVMQSSGTLKPVALESRGTDWGEVALHSFADVDLDADNVMDGPCELCHTRTGINHANYDFTDAHNDGRGCTETCHPHDRSTGAFFR